MKKVFASFRFRLLLLVFLAVLPAVGLILHTASEERRLAVAEVQANALRLAQLVASGQEEYIEGTRHLLVALAHLPAVRDRDAVACSAFFSDLLEHYPLYANLSAAAPNGDMFCSTIASAEPINSADLAWFQRAVSTRDFAIGDYQIGRFTDKPVLVAAYPVFDEVGSLQAVVTAPLDLAGLSKLVADVQMPPGSTFTMIDHNGTILARYPEAEKWVGQTLPEASLVQALLTQGEGTAEIDGLDGITRLYAFTPLDVPPPGIYISIGIPKQVAFANVDRLLTRNLILLGLTTVLMLAVAWVGSDVFIMRRARALVNGAQRLAVGDLSARTGLPVGRDELGQAARAFDQMAEALGQREAERKRAEAQIAYQSYLLENVHDAILATDDKFILNAWNHTAEEMYSWKMDEVIGRIVQEVLPSEFTDVQRAEALRSLAETGHYRAEVLQYRRDGQAIYVEGATMALRGTDGCITGYVSVNRDITERKRTEAALAKAEALLRTVLSNAPITIFAMDDQGVFTLSEGKGLERVGLKPGEHVGDSALDLYASMSFVKYNGETATGEEVIRRVLAGETVTAVDELNGVYFDNHIGPIRDGEGKIVGVVGVATDITERRQVEEELRRKEIELREAQRVGHLGSWDWDARTDTITWSDEYYRLYGFDPKLPPPGYVEHLRVYTPESAAWLDAAVSKSMETGEPYELDLEALYPDGAKHWITARGEVKRGAGGKIIGLRGTAQDITERKRAEQTLRESEVKFRGIYAQSPFGIELYDSDGRLVDANPACLAMFGVSGLQSVMGFDLFNDPNLPEDARTKLLAGEPVKYEAVFDFDLVKQRKLYETTRSGKCYLDCLVTPLVSEQSAINGYLVHVRDISARKRGETALKESEVRYRTLFNTARDAIFIMDEERFISCNQAAVQMFDCIDQHDMLEHTPWDFSPARQPDGQVSKQKAIALIQSALNGNPLSFYWLHSKKDGSLFDAEVSLSGVVIQEKPFLQAIVRDITERKRAEEELAGSREQLRALSQYLQSALEEERTAVAREIHDELGQSLTALKMDLAWLTRHLSAGEQTLREKTEAMSALTDATIQTVRQIATELRPGMLDDLGLVAALEWQAGEFQKRARIACELRLPEEALGLDRDVSTAVFRIFQETLTNIARHADATRVRVELSISPQKLTLVVQDNGRGITEKQVSDPRSLGLIGMRERVRQRDGEMTLHGKPGRGTTVKVRIPLTGSRGSEA